MDYERKQSQNEYPSFSTPLFNNIAEKSDYLVTSNDYVTITRSNGSESITISDREISVIDIGEELNGKTIIKLDLKLTFDPKSLVFNKTEDLLVIYDDLNINILGLNFTNNKIEKNSVKLFNLNSNLLKDEKIIQVIWNNISKSCSELLILTKYSIKVFDVLESFVAPIKLFHLNGLDPPAEETTPISSEAGNEAELEEEPIDDIPLNETTVLDFNEVEALIQDPVSICFGSSLDDKCNPKGDLTLFLLTSDSSIYKIFPFLPSTLSVTHKWTNTLFDYTSIKVMNASKKIKESKKSSLSPSPSPSPNKDGNENPLTDDNTNTQDLTTVINSNKDLENYDLNPELTPMLKLSLIISNAAKETIRKIEDKSSRLKYLDSSNLININIDELLSNDLKSDMLFGPFNITPFPDFLYDNDALKILPLPNDLVCVVYNKAVAVLMDDQNELMDLNIEYATNSGYFNSVLSMIDCIALDTTTNSNFASAILLPSSPTSSSSNKSTAILLTTTDKKLITLDFTQWVSVLTKCIKVNQLSEFMKLLENPLESTLTVVGDFYIPQGPSSEYALQRTTTTGNEGPTLCSNENKVWLFWDDVKMFAFVQEKEGAGVLSDITPYGYLVRPLNSSYLSSSVSSTFTSKERSTEILKLAETFIKDEKKKQLLKDTIGDDKPVKYRSFLVSPYSQIEKIFKDSDRHIHHANRKIGEMASNMNTSLNIGDALNAGTLSDINQISNVTTIDVLLLNKMLTTLINRMHFQILEYRQQIGLLGTIMRESHECNENINISSERFSKAFERNELTKNRILELTLKVQKILDSSSLNKNIPLSDSQRKYIQELNKLRKITIEKKAKLDVLNKQLENIKKLSGVAKSDKSDDETKSSSELLKIEKNKLTLEKMKTELKSRGDVIENLIYEIDTIHLD
ncbi:hypothetical protein B5S31_g2015 [[Candida] boidinii]|nr:hypothetical protein B5S31_g2015 [[Candida] boidinii]